MLKKRLKKWDIRRNQEESDVLYAVQLGIAAQNGSPGKLIKFTIRNRTVSFEGLKQYFVRKNVKDIQSSEYSTAIATSAVHTTLFHAQAGFSVDTRE